MGEKFLFIVNNVVLRLKILLRNFFYFYDFGDWEIVVNVMVLESFLVFSSKF